MSSLTENEMDRFREAVRLLEDRYADFRLEDEKTDQELRTWLDGSDQPLDWAEPKGVTPDEWFFISTLYGEMTLDGQRTHIRKYFPSLFVDAAKRDMRNFVPGMPDYQDLRSNWMSRRLAKMGEILQNRNVTMAEYTENLRELSRSASPADPMPALDAIIADHQASVWKTLSVFVRDCVGGNSFPIDSRVERELTKHDLPNDERALISACLELGKNPRQIARMFYQSGGGDD